VHAPSPPLDGVRVVDFAGPIGAYATKLLADLGADVIKVEPPLGDGLRRTPPFLDGARHPEASLMFAYYDANKRGITLTASDPACLGTLHDLGAAADVLMISPSPRAPLAGFDGEELSLAFARPDAIVCSITPFGLTGPYRHRRSTHFVSFAMGGGMHKMGPPEGPPSAIPGRQLWDETGTYAALAVLAARHALDEVGGQVIDIAAHEVAAIRDDIIDRYSAGMFTWGRTVAVGIPPSGTWRCRDGYFDIAAHQDHHWEAFLTMLDHPPELAEPALGDMVVRRDLHDGVSEVIASVLAPRSREELLARGQAAGLPCGLLNTPAEFLCDEQPRARGSFVTLECDGIAPFRAPGPALRATPALHRLGRPAPRLGEHNYDVYVTELGHSEAELEAWKACGRV
jgi:crotonobetainyl-CoA:carnitine CoA-transferase CaiB-like acyl-CoA transferase